MSNQNPKKSCKLFAPNVYIKTFGCQMNVADSSKMKGVLTGSGYSVVDDEKKADIILLNTCSVREHAEQKVWSKLGELRKKVNRPPTASSCRTGKSPSNCKQLQDRQIENRKLIVGVVGCMAQQYGKKIFEKAPNVNLVCGTYRFNKIDNIIKKACVEKRTIDIETGDNGKNGSIHKKSADASSFVPISRGCNNNCSYCIVPKVRGPERNRPVSDILSEVESLAGNGYKEITLLGQNVNSYKDGQDNFVDILRKLNDLTGIERIKFMTSHPKDAGLSLFKAIRDLDKVCHALHLPVQSGSNKVLEKMNRGYTREHYLRLMDNVKEIVPDVSLSTDIIVGFPGETDNDFQDTYNLMKDAQFDGAFIFKYSKRPGTQAEKYEDDVPLKEKMERNNCLLKLQGEISQAKKLHH